MIFHFTRRVVGLLFFWGCLIFSGAAGAQRAQVQQAHIKRTYFDYAGRQLHEEYQYVSTPTNRFSKQGYYKEFNEDGTLWRKHNYRNNKADGRQLEYSTSDGETWLQYDMAVRNNLMNGPYIRYSGPGERISAGNYVNGERAGQWKFYYPEGHEVCTYRDDKKEGPATLYYKNGKVADQYNYRDDEKYNDGDVKAFYEDGSPKKSGHFTDGEMDGKFLAWYSNGQLRYEENYVAGSREGRILAFGQRGDTLADDRYMNDILVAHRKSAQEVAQAQQIAQEQAQMRRERQHRDSLRVSGNLIQAKMDSAKHWAAQAESRYAEFAKLNGYPTYAMNAAESALAKSWRIQPDPKLYGTLYGRLHSRYLTSRSTDDRLALAKRMAALMLLAQQLAEGQQPDLNKAIRREKDLDKVLALTGL